MQKHFRKTISTRGAANWATLSLTLLGRWPTLLLSAAFAMSALLLVGCGGSSVGSATSSSGASGRSQIVNPIVAAESTAAIQKQLGVVLTVPEDVVVERMSVIDETLGEVVFLRNGQQYIYRGTSTPLEEDISGLYYEFAFHTTAEIDGRACTLELNEDGPGYCRWYDAAAGISYSVSVDTGANSDKLVDTATVLITEQG